MKIFFLLLLIPCYCLSQNNISTLNYELTRTVELLTFNAYGVLKVDFKNKTSNFKLSQYVNKLKGGDFVKSPLNENDSLKVIGPEVICRDYKFYYNDFKKDSTYTILYNTYCKNKVLIKDTINYPKWEIKDECKKIGKYNAQKATAFINDRTWTVYFTNELGVHGGPWRLIGLPGLVLEATATENTTTYKFKLTEINKYSESSKVIKPYHKSQTTFNKFVEKSIKESKERELFLLSKIPGVIIDEIDINSFHLFETLDYIEKRN